MYKVIMLDNYLDSQKMEVYEKACENLESAEEVYAGLFLQVKKLILEMLKLMLEADKTQALVIQQIIDTVNDIELNEDIELKAGDETFLSVEKNNIEFCLAGKHIVAKIVEV